jgi:hypothetical protein
MVQITFLTFFFTLTSGIQPVEVAVTGPVAAVELQLDGLPLSRLAGPPWVRPVDFGRDLLPHELVARALDAGGVEVARARQWVNLPRSPAEVILTLEGDPERPAAVRLSWETLVSLPRPRITLKLDGKRLAVSRKGRAALPSGKAEVPHLLSADLDFGRGLEARRDVVFGVGSGEAFGELTAVPVRGAPPPPEQMRGWFTAGGTALRPRAVEGEGSQVVLVADIESYPYLFETLHGKSEDSRDALVSTPALGLGDRLRFLWPKAEHKSSSAGRAVELFNFYKLPRTSLSDLELLEGWLRRGHEKEGVPGQRLADGVAVAGLGAYAGNRPRAVVLLLGRGPVDESHYAPATVRRYLEALRVPLHVWSLVPPDTSHAAQAWSGAEDVSTRSGLMAAVDRLHQELQAQRIVFFEGLHLPQTIELTPAAVGIELP